MHHISLQYPYHHKNTLDGHLFSLERKKILFLHASLKEKKKKKEELPFVNKINQLLILWQNGTKQKVQIHAEVKAEVNQTPAPQFQTHCCRLVQVAHSILQGSNELPNQLINAAPEDKPKTQEGFIFTSNS